MFYTKANNTASAPSGLTARARGAGTAAALQAQAAALSAQAAAQTAAQGVGGAFRQGVYNARGWAAPWLENAADYCTSTAAPAVSSALRSTASQVRPADTSGNRNRGMRSVLSWSALAAAAVAAVGAAVALVRHRYRAAMDADTEADLMEPEGAQPEAGEPAGTASPDADVSGPGATSADTGADGRVSASGQQGPQAWR